MLSWFGYMNKYENVSVRTYSQKCLIYTKNDPSPRFCFHIRRFCFIGSWFIVGTMCFTTLSIYVIIQYTWYNNSTQYSPNNPSLLRALNVWILFGRCRFQFQHCLQSFDPRNLPWGLRWQYELHLPTKNGI